MTIISLLITLSVLILVHEWGHFAAAKWVGIQVPRFSLGLGPKVWGFKRGETEYVLSAIPLGGYVKMAGMEDDEAQSALEGGDEGEPIDPERTFDSKPIWARTLVISAGVIMNLLFAVVTFTVIALAYGEAVLNTTRVAPAPDGLAQAIPVGSKIESIGGRRVETFNEIAEALRDAPAGPVRIAVEGGQVVTLHLPEDPEARVAVYRALPPLIPPVVGRVEPGSAAEEGGLRDGDRVLSIGGLPVQRWEELVTAVRGSPERPLSMEVERAGVPTRVTITPESATDRDSAGNRITIGRAGVAPTELITRRRIGPLAAVKYGLVETWATSAAIGDVLRKLVTGQMSTSNLGGLISIGQASGESARMGLEYFLGFLALFSVNLAILNLLPIPILDGGHLMFLLAEALRGRPLSVETRVRLSQLGLIVVVALMLLANGNDVVKVVQRWMGS